MNSMFFKWVALTFLCGIAFFTLDIIFGLHEARAPDYFDAAFLAFVILWCEQQAGAKRK